ncbi:ATP/GTP-binding protein [Flavihumibacter sp. R14]|nr:ATP/GTP-binding protein [Flavihumibacter soli]
MCKGLLFMATLMCTSSACSQESLVKLWETDSILKVPESVLYYPGGKALFVSNIDGKPGEKDLKGSIARVSVDGKKVEQQWAINLSAPKGMGIFKNTLYVADLDQIVAIDLNSGKVSKRYPVEGAVFLNDVTVDRAGAVFVSDSRTGKVHRLQNGQVSTYLENQMGVNGLLAAGDDLYLLAKGKLWKADKSKSLTKIAEGMDESTDGIEQKSDKSFVVSCWNGVIYHVSADGGVKELLDTRPQKVSSADIGFDPRNNIIYVPTFFGNKVVAYQLK